MKKTKFKRALSLMLVAIMAFSTMAMAVTSASATTDNVTYSFNFQTAPDEGKSDDDIEIKVNGDNGSTGWHNLGEIGDSQNETASFTDVNVGNVQSITVKNSGGIHLGLINRKAEDGWYPEIIKVTKEYGSEKFTTTIHGGRWIDNEVATTLSIYDNVFKLDINTSTDSGAGTNGDVSVTLYDKNNVASNTIKASELHPKTDAFEAGDKMSLYIAAPSKFDVLNKIKIHMGGNGVYAPGADWKLGSITVTQVSGNHIGYTVTKEVNQWYENGSDKQPIIYV